MITRETDGDAMQATLEQFHLGQAAYWIGTELSHCTDQNWRAGWLSAAAEARRVLTEPLGAAGVEPRRAVYELPRLGPQLGGVLAVLGLFHGKKVTPGERIRVIEAETTVRQWLDLLGEAPGRSPPTTRRRGH